jgi:hypothetical protein
VKLWGTMEWLKISEQVPVNGRRVLISNAVHGWVDLSILCEHWVGSETPDLIWMYGNKLYPFDRVTHWMEIPSLPKDKE